MKFLPLAALVFLGSLPLEATRLPAAKTTETVMVVVSALASSQAVVKLNFYNAPEKFLKDGQVAIRLIIKPEGRKEITVPVELTPGEWAVALTQDLNNNDKLDKNFLGIPTEPFAFSNNIKPRFAAPSFQECKFMVAGPGQVINITSWNDF